MHRLMEMPPPPMVSEVAAPPGIPPEHPRTLDVPTVEALQPPRIWCWHGASCKYLRTGWCRFAHLKAHKTQHATPFAGNAEVYHECEDEQNHRTQVSDPYPDDTNTRLNSVIDTVLELGTKMEQMRQEFNEQKKQYVHWTCQADSRVVALEQLPHAITKLQRQLEQDGNSRNDAEPAAKIEALDREYANKFQALGKDVTRLKAEHTSISQLANMANQANSTAAGLKGDMKAQKADLAKLANHIKSIDNEVSLMNQLQSRLEAVEATAAATGATAATVAGHARHATTDKNEVSLMNQLRSRLEAVEATAAATAATAAADAVHARHATTDKNSEIAGNNIELAYLEKSDKKVAELATAIGKLQDDYARLDAEKKDATAAHDKEHAESIKASTATALAMKKLQKGLEGTAATVAELADGQKANATRLDALTTTSQAQRDQINDLQEVHRQINPENLEKSHRHLREDMQQAVTTLQTEQMKQEQQLTALAAWLGLDFECKPSGKGKGKDKGKSKDKDLRK